jgi:hypothetical protein
MGKMPTLVKVLRILTLQKFEQSLEASLMTYNFWRVEFHCIQTLQKFEQSLEASLMTYNFWRVELLPGCNF